MLYVKWLYNAVRWLRDIQLDPHLLFPLTFSLSLYTSIYPSIWFCTSTLETLTWHCENTNLKNWNLQRKKDVVSRSGCLNNNNTTKKKKSEKPFETMLSFMAKRRRFGNVRYVLDLRSNKAKADRPQSRERVRRKSTWSSFPVIWPLTVQCQAYLAARDGAVMSPSRTTWKWR